MKRKLYKLYSRQTCEDLEARIRYVCALSMSDLNVTLLATEKGHKTLFEAITDQQITQYLTNLALEWLIHAAYKHAASTGQLNNMIAIEASMSPDKLREMRDRVYYVAYSEAAGAGHVEAMQYLEGVIAPDKLQEMVGDIDYRAYGLAVVHNHVHVMKYLESVVVPEKLQEMLAAGSAAVYRHNEQHLERQRVLISKRLQENENTSDFVIQSSLWGFDIRYKSTLKEENSRVRKVSHLLLMTSEQMRKATLPRLTPILRSASVSYMEVEQECVKKCNMQIAELRRLENYGFSFRYYGLNLLCKEVSGIFPHEIVLNILGFVLGKNGVPSDQMSLLFHACGYKSEAIDRTQLPLIVVSQALLRGICKNSGEERCY